MFPNLMTAPVIEFIQFASRAKIKTLLIKIASNYILLYYTYKYCTCTATVWETKQASACAINYHLDGLFCWHVNNLIHIIAILTDSRYI